MKTTAAMPQARRHPSRLATLLLLAAAGSTPAAVFEVTLDADLRDAAPGDGICAAAAASGPQCTLRAAIEEANASAGLDTILLPAGVFELTLAGGGEDAAASGDLDITDPLNVLGAGAGSSIVRQRAADRVFDVGAGAQATLSRLTIAGGGGIETGGGIRNLGVLAVTDCEVSGNGAEGRSVRFGGGVFNAATIAITGSRIIDNRVGGDGIAGAAGAGIYNTLAAAITGSRVEGNEAAGPAAAGGGIFQLAPGVLQVGLSSVTGNSAANGAGVAIGGGTVNLSSALLAENAATAAGGGLRVSAGTATLTNSTLSGNSADADGGGIAANGGSVALAFVTVAANLADADDGGGGNGGGVWIGPAAAVSVRHGLIADNLDRGGEAPDCSGALVSLGHALLESSSGCALASGAGDLVGVDAGIGPLADNGGPTRTHALSAASPALDAGDASGCVGLAGTPLLIDQRGSARPRDGDADGVALCDRGAYELVSEPLFDDGYE